jgi:hypothetical protein
MADLFVMRQRYLDREELGRALSSHRAYKMQMKTKLN